MEIVNATFRDRLAITTHDISPFERPELGIGVGFEQLIDQLVTLLRIT